MENRACVPCFPPLETTVRTKLNQQTEMNNILLRAAAICLLFGTSVNGASIVVDSFTEGDHFLSIDGARGTAALVTSPFGSTRATRISNRLAAPGTVMTSTLSTTGGTLDFVVDGMGLESQPLDLRMSYVGGGPFSLLGYSAFELDILAFSGSGSLIVELGNQTDVYGPTTNRIALAGSGTVIVPFSELNFGTNGSIASFSSMHFSFEAGSEEFSMTLGEIRVVPEPSIIMLALPFWVTILIRRRRN